MPDNISLNDLFKTGLKKDQFKAGVVAGKDNDNLSQVYSLFGDDIEGSADNIFAAMDTNNNGTLDEVEINELKNKFSDENNNDVSENDVTALAMESVMKQYGTTKPSQMYANAMSKAGDNRTSDYVPSLDNQIQACQDLITNRRISAKTKIDSYQNEIDKITQECADNKGINTSKYRQTTEQLKDLNAKAEDNSAKLEQKQRELENAKQEKVSLDKELKRLQEDPEKNKAEIEGVQFDLQTNAKTISGLTSEIDNLSATKTSLSSQIKSDSKNQKAYQEEIISGNAEAKTKIRDLKNKIKAEEKDRDTDIKNYQNEIDRLSKAREYAIAQMNKQAATASDNPVDADFNNTGKNCPDLNGVNYSSAKGQKLADYMRKHSIGFTGHCSRYVANGLAATGLGHERTASAHMMDTPLSKNSNFKEITVSSQAELKNLPAGCIIVYEAGAAGYNKTHGHIEVTLGNGTNCSDGITKNPRYAAGEKMHVFVPVA